MAKQEKPQQSAIAQILSSLVGTGNPQEFQPDAKGFLPNPPNNGPAIQVNPQAGNMVSNTAGNALSGLVNAFYNALPSKTYSFGYNPNNPQPTPTGVPTGAPAQITPTPQAGGAVQGAAVMGGGGRPTLNADLVKAAILRWSGGNQNVPALQYADQLAQAGNMMPGHIDPWLPTIMALRETLGGQKMSGQNDAMFNSRNGAGGFQDYSSQNIGILGGSDQSGQHAGFVGTINHTVPGQSDIYGNFRNTGNMGDFFSHYSPPTDNNGSIPTQINNYNWMRNKMTGMSDTQNQGQSAYDANNIPQSQTNSFALANSNQ